ncbi:MAG: type II and III secretion system protein family protein [Alphaproteobacteria bacterium]
MTRITRHFLRPIAALACAALTWATIPAPSAHAVERVVSQTTSIAIEISKGELYKLSSPAATVFIADPDIADVQVMSATLIYIYGIRAGDTNLYAVGANDQVIANMTIHVVPNITRLDQAINQIAPDSTVSVTAVQDSLIITGAVNSAVEAADLNVLASQFIGEDGQVINRARVHGPNQINVRVRFIEARRSDVSRFGINWESILSSQGLIFGLGSGVDWLIDEDDGTRTWERTTGGFEVAGGYNRGSRDINVMIDAMESEGLVSILAEPNLTAVSGETASFLAGGEFPIPLRGSDGDFYVEFRQFGVSLNFTATLLADNRISMRVRPEVSELSDTGAVELDGFSIPALITRRAETTVEMTSGQPFAIAGLFQSRTSNDVGGLPIMRDLPIIGALFRSEDYQRNESELVIVITPYLVQPPVTQQVVSPTDPMAAVPGIGGPTAQAPSLAPAGGLNGGGGFILQ